jgi:hypothetical protein
MRIFDATTAITAEGINIGRCAALPLDIFATRRSSNIDVLTEAFVLFEYPLAHVLGR